MPNWVTNCLTITGEREDLLALAEQVGKSYTRPVIELKDLELVTEIVTVEKPLSFWNIIAPTDLETYAIPSMHFGDRNPAPAEVKEKIAASMASGNNWYDWNLTNWGTKWDARDVELDWAEDGALQYHFSTAWSPVNDLIVRLSEQNPNVQIEYYYEEEQGWGGELILRAGELKHIEEWDIPNSHAEHELRNAGQCLCEVFGEKVYDDCPEPQDTPESEDLTTA